MQMAVQPIFGHDADIQAAHRRFVLAATYFLMQICPPDASNAVRLLGQYRQEVRAAIMLTGVYNRAFLDSAYRKKWRVPPAQASRQAWLLPA